MAKFNQNIKGQGKGTQIDTMEGNYIESNSITIGLSANEVTQLVRAIEDLRKKDREFDTYLQQINEAKNEEEKKGLARKAAAFMRQRGCGIFDSLVANAIFAMAKKLG
jgi:hypothetical protein